MIKVLQETIPMRLESKPITLLAIALFLLLFALPVTAQQNDSTNEEDAPPLDLFDEDTERTQDGWSQFYVAAGITYLDADGRLGAQLPSGENITIIDFDRVGLKETDSSYWLSLNWRSANSRWGTWFGSWRYDVTGSRVWEDTVEIPGKDPVPAGADVQTTFDAKWYILEGTYSFYRSKTIDTGIGFGLHTVDLDTRINARIQVADESGEVVSERLDTLAPLPNVLGYLHWKFAPRWSFIGRYGWFGLDYKEYSGQMTNAHAMVTFKMSPRWALGAGYQFVNLDLEVEKKEYIQDYDIQFSGPMAFLRFHF